MWHIDNSLRILINDPSIIARYVRIMHILILEWRTLEHFKSLFSVLPHNYHERLNSIPELLKDGGEQLSKLISSSPAKINEKIIAYLIVKLCYDDSGTIVQ